MILSNTIHAATVEATAALAQKTFVGFDGATAVEGHESFGVARTDAAAGELVAITTLGTAVVIAGGAIAKGSNVEVGASGHAITATTGTVVGRAFTTAAAAGDEVLIFVKI